VKQRTTSNTAGAKLHRNVWVSTSTSFLTDVSSEMLVNVLSLFLANVLGVRIWTVGVICCLGDSASSVLKLYSGWLSDRLCARKWPAVSVYATSPISRPFLYVASTWGAVITICFADHVGKGIRAAPRDALLANPLHRSVSGWPSACTVPVTARKR